MICGHCLEDTTCDYYIGGECYCSWCYPKVKERIESRLAYWEKIGHSGDDMCGCPMCAAREERDY